MCLHVCLYVCVCVCVAWVECVCLHEALATLVCGEYGGGYMNVFACVFVCACMYVRLQMCVSTQKSAAIRCAQDVRQRRY